MNTDRVEKTIVLHASLERVWRAISDPVEFGAWFGMKFHGAFVPGATVRATIVGTTADPQVAAAQKQFEGVTFEIFIDRIEPRSLLSFRWHPGEPGVDYSSEPATLVTFKLEEIENAVRLTVTETGFDKIPLARRAKAFAQNDQGWRVVVQLLEKHLAQIS